MFMIEDYEKRITAALDAISARLETQSPPASVDSDATLIDTLKHNLSTAEQEIAALKTQLETLIATRAQEQAEVETLYQKLADALNTPSQQKDA